MSGMLDRDKICRAMFFTDSALVIAKLYIAILHAIALCKTHRAQSKLLLSQSNWPHFTLLGRKGGSAVAAACVNAMAELALKTTG